MTVDVFLTAVQIKCACAGAKEAPPFMKVIGDIDGDGLGCADWWESADD